MTDKRAWSILTKSVGGAVSAIRDLTLEECREIYDRLDPWYGEYYNEPRHEDGGKRTWGDGSGVTLYRDGGIEVREVFGPPGWDRSEMNSWGQWPKERETEASS